MAYQPPASTIKVGDIFTDELITKINEILLDIKNAMKKGENETKAEAYINILDDDSPIYHIFTFFYYDNYTNNIKKSLKYYKSFEEYDYGGGTPLFIIPVDHNFQINADIIMQRAVQQQLG